MRRPGGGNLVQSLGVKSKTEGGLDTRAQALGVAESDNTRVVDLRLEEGGVVKVAVVGKIASTEEHLQRDELVHSRLGTDLEGNTRGGSLGVVDGFGTSLDVTVDAVVVAGREGAQVVESVNGDGVFRCAESDGRCVAGNLALGDVVGSLSSNEEPVTSNNGVGGEGGSLRQEKNENVSATGMVVEGLKWYNIP